MKKLVLSIIVVTVMLLMSVSAHASCECNLIVNGDFELGNQDFITEYIWVAPPGYLHPDGRYTVYTDPHLVHSGFTSYWDHTINDGTGNMLIVNAASNVNTPGVHIIWQQTVTVTANTNYTLTYWLSSCHSSAPANIECSIDGDVSGLQVLGTRLAPTTTGLWIEVSYSWNSGSNTSATIILEDLTRAYSGDDFAIDDISFCAPEQIFDLWAGQCADDIGEVVVWNDGVNLYVNFVTDEVLLETHVHVASDLGEIPKTKKGNPIPGQFEYSNYYPEDHEYIIPLTWDPGTPLYIAAHAATGVEESMTIFSDNDGKTSVMLGNEPLAIYPYPAVDAWEYNSDPPDSIPSVWDNMLMYKGWLSADWIWESYRTVDPTTIQSVDFQQTFTVDGYPNGGTLYIAADNMYQVSLNSEFIGEHLEWQNWQIVGQYDIFPISGLNVLDITASNYGDPGYNINSNPAGLIYEAEIDYYADGETAWGDGCYGESFPGSNWATYFTYTVQDCQ